MHETSSLTRRAAPLFIAVVANGFDRAAFEGFHAHFDFFRSRGLLHNEGIAAVITAREEIRRRFAAQIAVDALLIDVEFSLNVIGPLVVYICHDRRTFCR